MTSTLKNVLLGIAAAAAVGQAAAAPQSDAETMLAGTWLGEFRPSPEQPLQRFLNRRKPDGTFELVARMYEPQKPSQEVTNSGLWGVSNGLYFTVTTVVNGQKSDVKAPESVNSYIVQSLKPDEFAYRHVLSGYTFQVRKVPDDTRLP